jgi:hypothetical protein
MKATGVQLNLHLGYRSVSYEIYEDRKVSSANMMTMMINYYV